MPTIYNRISETLALKREWSFKTFGSPTERGPVGPLKHFIKELEEVRESPNELFEYADLLFLVDDAAVRAGHFSAWETFRDIELYELILNRTLDYKLHKIQQLATHLIDHPEDMSGFVGLYQAVFEMLNATSFGVSDFDRALRAKYEILLTRTYNKVADGLPSEHVR